MSLVKQLLRAFNRGVVTDRQTDVGRHNRCAFNRILVNNIIFLLIQTPLQRLFSKINFPESKCLFTYISLLQICNKNDIFCYFLALAKDTIFHL